MISHQLVLKFGLLGVGIVSACSLTVPSDDEVFARGGANASGGSAGSGNTGAVSTGGAGGTALPTDGGAGGEPAAVGGQSPQGGKGPHAGSGGGAGDMEGGAGGAPPKPPISELVNPSFENGLNGWSIDPPSAADPAAHAPAKPPVFQQWGGTGAVNVKAFDGDYVMSTWYESAAYTARVYQVLDGLEDGTYTLKAHVSNIATINTAELYAKGCSETDPTPLAIPGSDSLVERTLGDIVVKGGTCEVGINIDAKAADWLNVDLFSFEKVEPPE